MLNSMGWGSEMHGVHVCPRYVQSFHGTPLDLHAFVLQRSAFDTMWHILRGHAASIGMLAW